MPAVLIYCYDPMCSWCWGFRPTWNTLEALLADDLARGRLIIQPMLGGLAEDSDRPMPEEMKQKLASIWKQIETTLGTSFNYDFWTSTTPRRSTYPACRACLVARDFDLESEMRYEIQQAYYLNAQNPSDIETLTHCAERIGINPADFTSSYEGIVKEQRLEGEIQRARAMGLNSFPSLALLKGDSLYPVPLNYRDAHSMKAAIDELLR
jgi:putative protein-disulfide isomerase